jgi:hypothetical protein
VIGHAEHVMPGTSRVTVFTAADAAKDNRLVASIAAAATLQACILLLRQ